MMACKDVSKLIASDELARAGSARRLGARLHLLMCRQCRRYAKQMRAIWEYARAYRGIEAHDSPTLRRLERDILERLSEHLESSAEHRKKQDSPQEDFG